ncbi:MAG: ankX [Gammaproteobacteria bacterium]|jgi:ankyrin repeat protein|nr:ankX [Gammaproteobacteria bacterium]
MFHHSQSPSVFDQFMTILQKDDKENQPEKDMQTAATLIESDKRCLAQTDSLNDWQLLHFAVLSDHPLAIELVQLLCESGANINAQARQKDTPLHLAILKNKVGCVRYLLANGADPTLRNDEGQTAKDVAEKKGFCLEELKHVMKIPPRGMSVEDLCSQLVLMELKDVRDFLEREKDCLKFFDEKGWTLLHYAVSFNSAIYKSQEAFIALLCEFGANVNGLNFLGESPLYLATRSGNINYISLLLQYKSNVLLTDSAGRTALYAAIMTQNKACFDLLLDSMQDYHLLTHIADANQQTLLHFSVEMNNLDSLNTLLSLISKSGKYSQEELNNAVNFKDHNGQTALHFAAKAGRLECVKALIDIGADINVQDSLGNTPLHCAVYHFMNTDEDDVVRLLLQGGADHNRGNKSGETWLDLMVMAKAVRESPSKLEDVQQMWDRIFRARYKKEGDPCPHDDMPLIATNPEASLEVGGNQADNVMALHSVSGQQVITKFFDNKQSPCEPVDSGQAQAQTKTTPKEGEDGYSPIVQVYSV